MNNYFIMYFKESDKIREFSFFKEVEINGTCHIFDFNYTKEDILKIILALPKDIQDKIRDTFIKIDFKNGDINHFLEYLLNGHCEALIKQQVKVYQECKYG